MSKFNAVLLTSLLNSIIPELPLALMVFTCMGNGTALSPAQLLESII